MSQEGFSASITSVSGPVLNWGRVWVETKGLCSVVGIWGVTSLMGAVVLSPFPVNPVLFKLRYDGHTT